MNKHALKLFAMILLVGSFSLSLKAEDAKPDNAAIIAKQKPTYPMKTCVVTGDKLEGDSIDYVYEGRLIRFCCKDCVKDFNKEPAKYLKVLDAAAAKANPK